MASPTRFASTIPPLEKRHSFAKSANEGLSMVVLVPYQLGVHRRHVSAWHQLKNQRRLSFNRKENGFKSIAERRNESELTSMQRWRSLIKSFKASSKLYKIAARALKQNIVPWPPKCQRYTSSFKHCKQAQRLMSSPCRFHPIEASQRGPMQSCYQNTACS
ncbi:hypothetical protein Ae201684P_000813 [Aphanomyces euteiches]|nr:hypothetical protein Ae201684P_000813 [Aphanomyces euteiches]